MYTSLSNYLSVLASRIILSFDPPSVVVKALEEFERLFEDDTNFIDSEKWGEKTTLTEKKIVPFSLSGTGLVKIRKLAKESETFAHIYRSGVAGINDEKYSLLYFLTQYILIAGNFCDYIELNMEYEKKDGELSPEKSKLFSSLEKKVEILRKVFERTNTRVLYREIPSN